MLNRIRNLVSGNGGFTLIEMVAVLVVVGILATFAAAKMVGIKQEAQVAGIKAAVNELNSRETLAHAKALLDDNYLDDAGLDSNVWAIILDGGSEPDLNQAGSTDYVWDMMGGVDQTGGDLSFKQSGVYDLARTAATSNSPAHWVLNGPAAP